MSALWNKARAAGRSAPLLLEAGDPDGAINRAYYAIFGAARAALSTVRGALAHSKRHATIVRRFHKHVVADRGFDPALGRQLFKRQRQARWIADYGDTCADTAQAKAAIADMERFLAAVAPLVTAAAAGKSRRATAPRSRAGAAHQDAANG